MKDPNKTESWKGIKELSAIEKDLISQILTGFLEKHRNSASMVTGALVVFFENNPARYIHALEAKDLEVSCRGKDAEAQVRVPFEYKVTLQDLKDAGYEDCQNLSVEQRDQLAKELVSDEMTELALDCAEFAETNFKSSRVYINSVTNADDLSELTQAVNKAFLLGRVNADCLKAKNEFLQRNPNKAEQKAFELGALVTSTQAFEQTELGKQLEKNLFELLGILL